VHCTRTLSWALSVFVSLSESVKNLYFHHSSLSPSILYTYSYKYNRPCHSLAAGVRVLSSLGNIRKGGIAPHGSQKIRELVNRYAVRGCFVVCSQELSVARHLVTAILARFCTLTELEFFHDFLILLRGEDFLSP